MTINEQIKTPVKREYDVAVCGGGFAGISAALAAARQGKKVVLFEKQYMLGGLGTAGIVTIYLPLCDGFGRQISYGISEELLRLSILHGAEDRYPENWLDGKGERGEKDKRFEVQYNPQLFAILAEKLLLKEGVDILYGTHVVGVDKDGDRINHLILEGKAERFACAVGSVVDATGDCDVAHFAGAPTETFKQGNVLAAWYYSLGEAGYKLNMVGYAEVPEEEKKETGIEFEPLVKRRFGGLDTEELSEQMQASHNQTYIDFLKKRENDKTILPVTIATTPQIRMTRRIVGEYELSDTEMHKYFGDSIGMVPNWKKRGPVYEIPFGALYSAKVRNLICAGRCVSTNETLWDVMRVIPCCAVTGEAAGVAASMTNDFTQIDIKNLQKKLTQNGVILHESDL